MKKPRLVSVTGATSRRRVTILVLAAIGAPAFDQAASAAVSPVDLASRADTAAVARDTSSLPWLQDAEALQGAVARTPAPPTARRPARRPARRSARRPARRPAALHAIASVRDGESATMRAHPGGERIGRLSSTTEFGSGRALSVVAKRGRWLGVSTAERPNGRLAWIDGRSPAIVHDATRLSLHADLSDRTLELRRGREVIRRMTVSIGRPGSTTPTGRFAITDKLPGSRFGSYYGCCILPLSATQPNLPPGWPGGDRLAIHGTSDPSGLGRRVSAGCLHAGEGSLRLLSRRLPIGTPVSIAA